MRIKISSWLILASCASLLAPDPAASSPALVQFGGIMTSFQDVRGQICSLTEEPCPLAESGFFTIEDPVAGTTGDIVAGSAIWDPDAVMGAPIDLPEGGTVYLGTVRDFSATVFRQSAPTTPYTASFDSGGTLVRNDNDTRFAPVMLTLDSFELLGNDLVAPVTENASVGSFEIREAGFGINASLPTPQNPTLLDSEALPQDPDALLDAGGIPFVLFGYGTCSSADPMDPSCNPNPGGNAVGAIGFQESWEASTMTAAELGLSAQLTTGSPTALSQTIQATPEGAFLVTFNALFETPEGSLAILLDGAQTGFEVDLSRLPVDGLLDVSVLVRAPSLFGRDDVDLTIRVDGPTGSSVRLDNIALSQGGTVLPEALQNGDFEGGSLAGWTVQASGAGGARVVPEPSTSMLLACALGALAARRRRQRSGVRVERALAV